MATKFNRTRSRRKTRSSLGDTATPQSPQRVAAPVVRESSVLLSSTAEARTTFDTAAQATQVSTARTTLDLSRPDRLTPVATEPVRLMLETTEIPRTQSVLSSQSVPTEPARCEPMAIEPAQTVPASQECELTEAIGKVFQSKTEARQRRKDEGLQPKIYQQETRRPIVCLAFVLPLVIFYEIGSILLGPTALRSGVDQWIHQFLQQLGFGELFLLPLLTVGLILAWHHRIDDHWRIDPGTLIGKCLEAAGLGLILFCAANSLNLLFGGGAPAAQTAMDLSSAWWANIISHIGSGIYEELVFRLLLLTAVIYAASRLCKKRKLAMVLGVIVVSLIFAALHYNFFNPAGSQFELSSFSFRFVASIVFCVLFLYRGFGIAVGTHVAYDVLTQI